MTINNQVDSVTASNRERDLRRLLLELKRGKQMAKWRGEIRERRDVREKIERRERRRGQTVADTPDDHTDDVADTVTPSNGDDRKGFVLRFGPA